MSLLTNKEKAQCIVAGLAAAFALTFVIEALATVIFMPEVQISHSTGECVKVIILESKTLGLAKIFHQNTITFG